MAVIRCKEVLEGRGGSDVEGVVTATRVFHVETSTKLDGPITVIRGLKYEVANQPLGTVPVRLYDPHPDDGRAILRGAHPDPSNSPTTWLVRLDYSSAPFPARNTGSTAAIGGGTALDPANPTRPSNDPATGHTTSKPATDRLPTVNRVVKVVEVPAEVYHDATTEAKSAYVNAVGDPLEGLTKEVYTDCLTVTYFSFDMHDEARTERIGVVNRLAWGGFPPGGCIVRDVKREDAFDYLGDDAEGPVFGLVWKVSVEIECVNEADHWRTKVLHTGRRGRLTAGGPVVTFFDRNGERVADPVPLNSAGVALRDPALANPTPILPAEFHYLTFRDRPEFDFADLFV